jgi:hypothetical protein
LVYGHTVFYRALNSAAVDGVSAFYSSGEKLGRLFPNMWRVDGCRESVAD